MFKVEIVGGVHSGRLALCQSFQEVEEFILGHWDNRSDYWIGNGKVTMEYRDIMSFGGAI